MRNKYIYRSRISEKKIREIIRLFSIDIEASKIAILTNLNRRTISDLLMMLRYRLRELCESESTSPKGVFECDESYFGARRVRGVRGRGARGKTIVFGIYGRNSKRTYTRVVPNVKSKTLIGIIEEKVPKTSIIYTDGFRSYFPLHRRGYRFHETVNHGRNEFARLDVHVNGIESFWSFAKTRLAKFRGLKPSLISLHLKESEYRFNHRNDNLYQLILSNLKNSPLNYP